MKYCLKWNNFCKHLKDADEISINYIEDKGLVKFMEKYAGKRIIIHLASVNFANDEIAKLAAIHTQYPDYKFTVALPALNLQLIAKLKEKDIPFYIALPVQNWEDFNYYTKELGVTDIDISGALGFELKSVRHFLDRNDLYTIVRATPNKITSISPSCPPLQQFFIRPDDIDIYAEYIDVIEFEGIEHQDTFFDLYANKKYFLGKLNQVIYNYPFANENVGLIDEFGSRRANCKRQCLSGGRCKRCEALLNISDDISSKIKEKIIK